MTIYMDERAGAGMDQPVSDAERKARVELAAAYRIFNMLGWVELIFNHITLRVLGPKLQFLINPFGLHYREVKASNLVLIDVEGHPVRETPWPVNRAGFMIHSAIHSAIERAHCVMHTHTTTGMAVACSDAGLSRDTFYGAMLHGRVAYHELEGAVVDAEEKRRLVKDMGICQAMILRNHGLLAWGPSVPEAFFMMWTLQRACDVQVATSCLGKMHAIREEVVERLANERIPSEERSCRDVFAALRRQLDEEDPSYRS